MIRLLATVINATIGKNIMDRSLKIMAVCSGLLCGDVVSRSTGRLPGDIERSVMTRGVKNIHII